MKKFIILFMVAILSISCASTKDGVAKKKWFEMDPRIEVVNENTVVFRDVVKIEIRTNSIDQVTHVYDLDRSRPVKIARGSFLVDVVRGDYLVVSNKKITRSVYDVIIE